MNINFIYSSVYLLLLMHYIYVNKYTTSVFMISVLYLCSLIFNNIYSIIPTTILFTLLYDTLYNSTRVLEGIKSFKIKKITIDENAIKNITIDENAIKNALLFPTPAPAAAAAAAQKKALEKEIAAKAKAQKKIDEIAKKAKKVAKAAEYKIKRKEEAEECIEELVDLVDETNLKGEIGTLVEEAKPSVKLPSIKNDIALPPPIRVTELDLKIVEAEEQMEYERVALDAEHHNMNNATTGDLLKKINECKKKRRKLRNLKKTYIKLIFDKEIFNYMKENSQFN